MSTQPSVPSAICAFGAFRKFVARTSGKSRRRAGGIAILLAAMLQSTAAFAEDVVVKRHVTVRESPTRQSDVVKFPAVGEALTLLDSGSKTHGYYHVRLSDGRTGWVYYTFVTRPEQLTESVAFQPGDVAIAHFIDMDQGNATLLEFPCGAVLIDAGGRDAAAGDHLIAYLDAFFSRRTDLNRHLAAVFVTHTHVDHNRALRRVAERFNIDGYVHNGVLFGSGRANANWMLGFAQTHAPVIPSVAADDGVIAAAGPQGLAGPVVDPVACPRVDPDIRVLSGGYLDNPGWPDGEFDNGNNHSLVIRVTYGRAKFLFTGDLEEPAIETLLAKYQTTQLLDVDVYEVGHHGSANGTTPALLAAMSPQISIISMGNSDVHAPWTAWAYGHPRRTVVTMIAQATSGARPAPVEELVADRVKHFSPFMLTKAIYATGWNGDVDVRALPDGTLTVHTSR
jgi:competence protein ComEC